MPVNLLALKKHSLEKNVLADPNCTVPKTDLADLADGSDEFWTNERLVVNRSSHYCQTAVQLN
jgi:hypothetical protein